MIFVCKKPICNTSYTRRFCLSVRVYALEKKKRQRGAIKPWRSSRFNCRVSTAAAGSLSDTLGAKIISEQSKAAIHGFARLVLTDAIKRPAKRLWRGLRGPSSLERDRRCVLCGFPRGETVERRYRDVLTATKARKCAEKLRYLPERQSAPPLNSGSVWESSFFQEVN